MKHTRHILQTFALAVALLYTRGIRFLCGGGMHAKGQSGEGQRSEKSFKKYCKSLIVNNLYNKGDGRIAFSYAGITPIR